MHTYLAVSIIIFLGQVGPQDAMLANNASVRSEIQFTYTTGTAPSKSLNYKSIWEGERIQVEELPQLRVSGSWSADGQTEKFSYSPGINSNFENDISKLKDGEITSIQPDFIVLTNGTTAATLDRRSDYLSLENVTLKPLRADLVGPHYRWAGEDLKSFSKHFTDYRKFTSEVSGKIYDIEVYRRNKPKGWEQLEVHYDPSAGYLPRYCKLISYKGEEKPLSIVEHLLVSSIFTKNGSSIPEKWYRLQYKAKYSPEYVKPASFALPDSVDIVKASFFTVDKYLDTLDSNTIKLPKKFNHFVTQGGAVKFRSQGTGDISLNSLVAMSGKKLFETAKLPSYYVDQPELAAEVHSKNRTNYLYLLYIIFLILVVFFISRKFIIKRLFPILVIILLPTGCSWTEPSNPVADNTDTVRISASFANPLILLDPPAQPQKLLLAIKNSGKRTVRITAVNGGCACRSVDQSRLPLNLSKDSVCELEVTMVPKLQQEAQQFPFSITTDIGSFTVPVRLLALPTHQLEPDSLINPSLLENDTWEFNLEHIITYNSQINQKIANFSEFYSLKIPKTFKILSRSAEELSPNSSNSHIKRVLNKYKIGLDSKDIGTYKEKILVIDKYLVSHTEIPIVWTRNKFLSSIPPKAIIGSRPVRVFLRCPDDTIELVRVIDAPKGVKAVIASPREVLVSLEKDSPSLIDSQIEILTTARTNSVLYIPVIHYHVDK